MRAVGLAWVCNSAGSHCIMQGSQRHSIAGISIRAFDIYLIYSSVLGLVGGVLFELVVVSRVRCRSRLRRAACRIPV